MGVDFMRVYNDVLVGNIGWKEFNPSWYYADNCFDEKEVEKIKNLKRNYVFKRAATLGKDSDSTKTKVRESQIFWIKQDVNTEWIYNRISWWVNKVNEERYHFDVVGLEQMQYTKYDAPDILNIKDKTRIRSHRDTKSHPGHYDWHIDGGKDTYNRKISVVVNLSDPSDYEGGRLRTNFSDGIITHGNGLGSCIIFPSFILHKVEPVTSGTRESLVCWIHGPSFR
jgi:PKHD-type hydroxylase